MAVAACTPETPEPGSIDLTSDNGYVLADSREELHNKVIGELRKQFGLNGEVTLASTKVREYKEYVLVLVDFVYQGQDEGNLLFIIHRESNSEMRWTPEAKVSTLACSDNLGCKLDVFENEEELIFSCPESPCGLAFKEI